MRSSGGNESLARVCSSIGTGIVLYLLVAALTHCASAELDQAGAPYAGRWVCRLGETQIPIRIRAETGGGLPGGEQPALQGAEPGTVYDVSFGDGAAALPSDDGSCLPMPRRIRLVLDSERRRVVDISASVDGVARKERSDVSIIENALAWLRILGILPAVREYVSSPAGLCLVEKVDVHTATFRVKRDQVMEQVNPSDLANRIDRLRDGVLELVWHYGGINDDHSRQYYAYARHGGERGGRMMRFCVKGDASCYWPRSRAVVTVADFMPRSTFGQTDAELAVNSAAIDVTNLDFPSVWFDGLRQPQAKTFPAPSASAAGQPEWQVSKAVTEDQKACLLNLLRIQAAKKAWGIATNQIPSAVPRAEDLSPFVRDGWRSIACPSGGSYSFGALDSLPSCSYTGHRFEK